MIPVWPIARLRVRIEEIPRPPFSGIAFDRNVVLVFEGGPNPLWRMRCLLDYVQPDQSHVLVFPRLSLRIVNLGVRRFVILFEVAAPRFGNNAPGRFDLHRANVAEFRLLIWQTNSRTILDGFVDPFLMPDVVLDDVTKLVRVHSDLIPDNVAVLIR